MSLVALTADRLALRNLSRVAETVGLELIQTGSLDEVTGTEPTAVVIDLEADGALEAVTDSKARWPLTMVIGVVMLPGGDVWTRGERQGCDLVTTRGALSKVIPGKLEAWMDAPGGRRIRLFAIKDVAGRLGVVDRLDDPDAGPLAVYHVGGEIRVAQDICPHAGARLSRGEVAVDDGVVTCPEHGSRFDVNTGERLRGPADDGIKTFRVVIDDGQAYVQLDP